MNARNNIPSPENPYDGYDALDPWDDDPDGSGNFSFVEDEYDSMESYEGDGLVTPFDSVDPYQPSGSTEAFPRTMVRPAVDMPYDEREREPRQDSRGGVLRRRRRADRRVGAGDPAARDPYASPVPSPEPAPRPARPRRRRRHHFGCLFTLLIMVAAVVGLYWVVAHPIDDKLAFSASEQQTVSGTLSWSVPGMPYYALALGSDAREGDAYSRTDTMVLVRVDFWGGKLTLVSVPRDTKVDIEGQGTQKINAAYAFGGAGGAVRAVSKLAGVPIHHVAVVHFEELVGLIDYLGGVTVNVPVGVSDPYTGLNISAGAQTMDGATALAWARSRYGYERGDYQRQDDQRILITAIMNRMLSLSPREIPGALAQMGDLIGTDMRCYDLVPLFVRFKLLSPTIYSCALPTTSAYVDDLWYEVVDDAKLAQLMQVVNAGGDPATVG